MASKKRLQLALAVAQGAHDDAFLGPSRCSSAEPNKALMSVADFLESCEGGGEDENDSLIVEPCTGIQQLMERGRQLEQRAESIFQGSLKSRSLLREVEGLLARHEQSADEYTWEGSDGDAIKAMRLRRCDELNAGLVHQREQLLSQSGLIDEMAQVLHT